MIVLADRGVRVVLLDIEGATTPMAFVHEVLFPYARAHLESFLDAHGDLPEVRRALALLAAEGVDDIDDLMVRDVKSPGLKLLQGQIWERGYLAGELRGQVFPDVAPAVRRWKSSGHRVAIYSSGSELAQRRLFETTGDGDLTPHIDAFFDTGVGPKKAPASYAVIATRLSCLPADIVFVSDLTDELAAAEQAGCHVLLSLRPGNAPQRDADRFEKISTFDRIK